MGNLVFEIKHPVLRLIFNVHVILTSICYIVKVRADSLSCLYGLPNSLCEVFSILDSRGGKFKNKAYRRAYNKHYPIATTATSAK